MVRHGGDDTSRLRKNHVRLQGNHLPGERAESVGAAAGKPVIDAQISAILPAMSFEALLKTLAPCLLLRIIGSKRQENRYTADAA